MEALLQHSLTGLMMGGAYALMAMAIVLVYKSTSVFNFATGALMMIGAFICWSLLEWGIPVWISVVIAAGASYLVGLLAERLALRPLIAQPIIAAIMATLALSILFHGLALLTWGPRTRAFATPIFPAGGLSIGPATVSGSLLGSFIIAVIMFGVLTFFFQRTHRGLSMRATAESHLLAQSQGIKVTSVFGLSWAIAAAVCAFAGISLADRLVLGATEIAAFAFTAFPAVLLGGLDSIPGAFIGGLIIGLAVGISSGYISPLFGHIVPYIILLIVLIIRPEGLWGLRRIERI